jgi:hypothetical protein
MGKELWRKCTKVYSEIGDGRVILSAEEDIWAQEGRGNRGVEKTA